MSEKAKLTPEFIYALISWQEEGNRSISIELNKCCFDEESKLKIWVYDFELLSGDFVSCVEEIPTSKDLLLQQKKDLEASRKHLHNQLRALEA